jgi:hypothetical protein
VPGGLIRKRRGPDRPLRQGSRLLRLSHVSALGHPAATLFGLGADWQ